MHDSVCPLVSELEKPKVFQKSRLVDKPFVSPSPSIRAQSLAHRLRSANKSVRGNQIYILFVFSFGISLNRLKD